MTKEQRQIYDCKARTTATYILDRKLRTFFRDVIRRDIKTSKYEKILGYTIQEFKDHIEARFFSGMTFDNYGEWHIDHIIGRCNFKYSTHSCEGFLACYSLSNLQPLWKLDNLTKKKKVQND